MNTQDVNKWIYRHILNLYQVDSTRQFCLDEWEERQEYLPIDELWKIYKTDRTYRTITDMIKKVRE